MRAPPTLSVRSRIVFVLGICGAASAWLLGLDPGDLVPSAGGRALAGEMLSAALRPALEHQDPIRVGGPSILEEAFHAARRTVGFAVASCSLALLWGLPLGLVASRSCWTLVGRSPGAIHRGARILAAALRSVHELLWAVLLLAALGLSDLTAVIALAVPYAGTFAKIFSELLDEAPLDAAGALGGLGAGPASALVWGVLPRAAPDLGAYTFYRFECALRSSVVLGFFGFPTLGYHVAASFENLYYREMWTYLYVLVALIVAADLWSAALRKRWVG